MLKIIHIKFIHIFFVQVSAFQCLFEVEGDQRFSIISDGPLDLTDDQMFSLQVQKCIKIIFTCSLFISVMTVERKKCSQPKLQQKI